METRSKTKYQKENKNCSPNNACATSAKQKMTLHPQKMSYLMMISPAKVVKQTRTQSLESARPAASLQKTSIHPNLPVQPRLPVLEVL